jgi:L-fuconolactonase
MPNYPIVDPHLHIWDQSALPYSWLKQVPKLDRNFSLEDYDEACGDVVVDRMVFVQCEVDRHQFLDEAAWVSEQAERDPRIQGMVTWAPVERGAAVAEDLERLKRFPLLRGVRQIIEFEDDPDFCLRPAVIEGVRALGAHGLSFDICINYRQLPKVVEFVRQCPDVPMVLDHVGKPGVAAQDLHPWREHFSALAALPNVSCKLSSLPTEADHDNWTRDQIMPFIEAAVEEYGFDRLMYAGDWPVSSQAIALDAWVRFLDDALSGTDEADLRKFWRDNAIAFYRLEPQA